DIRAMSSDVDGDAADVVLSIRVPQQIPASTILELYARTGDAALLQRLPMDHGVRHLQLVRVDGSWRVFRSFGSIAEALALDGDLETEPTDELRTRLDSALQACARLASRLQCRCREPLLRVDYKLKVKDTLKLVSISNLKVERPSSYEGKISFGVAGSITNSSPFAVTMPGIRITLRGADGKVATDAVERAYSPDF